MSFPRLLVGLAALRAGEDARSESERLGLEQSVVLGGEQIEEALDGIHRVSRWGRVVSETIGGVELRVDLGVVAMEGVKLPIVSIGGLVKRAALRPFVEWYAESAGSNKGKSNTGKGTGVLADLARDDRDPSGRDMDVALCEAFLADLRHSRRGRGRHPAPVVLLDNADAVDPDESTEAGTSSRTAGRSFLRLLKDSRPIRSEDAGTNEFVLPVAVVATARKPRPDHPLLKQLRLPTFGVDDCGKLMSWRGRRPEVVDSETARLVHEFSGGNPSVAAEVVRVSAEHPEDGGVLNRVLGRDDLESRLLDRLLDWSGAPESERAALEICALSRDLECAEQLAREEGHRLNRVAPLFFGDDVPDWTTPLRHLLVRRFARDDTGGERWVRYHEALAGYCERSGDPTGALYHRLALGGLGTVADELLTVLTDEGATDSWEVMLDEVTRAPCQHVEHWGEAPDERFVRLERESVGTGMEPHRGEARRLVAALWSLSDPFGGPERVDAQDQAAYALIVLRGRVTNTGVLSKREARHRRIADELRRRDVTYRRSAQDDSLVPPRPRGRGLLVVSLVVALVVGGAVAFGPDLVCGGPLSGLVRVEGECVGVNDGSHVFDPAFTEVQGLIERENTRVAGVAEEDGTPVARIALMTTLTPDGRSPLDTDRVRAAMEGAHVAQVRANQDQTFHGDRPLIQLYLANEGSRQQHWRYAVDRLVSLSEDDVPLLAVAGPGLSSDSAERAALELSGHRIPMVSGIVTADGLDASTAPGLMRASPTNSEYVASLVDHVESEHPTAAGILLYDNTEDDTYTATLREAYAEQFADHLPRNELEFTGRAMGQTAPTAFASAVNHICSQQQGLDLVFFAGREDDLDVFVNALAGERCVPEDPLTIVYAATGVTGGAELHRDLDDGNLDLAMASSTHPGWGRGDVASPAGFDGFHEVFVERIDADPARLDDGYAIMHHDAVAVTVHAVRLALEEVGGERLPTPEEVRNQLYYLHGAMAVSGAGGDLEYVAGREGNPVGKPVPVVLLGHSHGGVVEEAGSPPGEPYLTGEPEVP
ncbi:ABC transporter substrate-binding protein [Nocardiopsis sp. NPDC055551]|uniref:ABC transporter substrate-binding protein n=1 Tax=Nocardiopsis sp. NPDC006832 TaxID=3157188 RepID=UPI0033EBC71F